MLLRPPDYETADLHAHDKPESAPTVSRGIAPLVEEPSLPGAVDEATATRPDPGLAHDAPSGQLESGPAVLSSSCESDRKSGGLASNLAATFQLWTF